MKQFLKKLFFHERGRTDYPNNMQDLRGGDPCWCGSGKSYRRCHRREDRKPEKELGLNRRGKSICDEFT